MLKRVGLQLGFRTDPDFHIGSEARSENKGSVLIRHIRNDIFSITPY